MSAWMCSDALIKNVAINVLVGSRLSCDSPAAHLAECSAIATQLRDANVASLVALYGAKKAAEMAGGGLDEPLPPLEVTFDDVRTWERMSFVQQAKNIACFDYQACEVVGYDETPAGELTRRALNGLVSRQPGYNEAEWGWGR